MRAILSRFALLTLLVTSTVFAETTSAPIRAIVDAGEQPDNVTILDRRGDWWLVEGTAEQISIWPNARLVAPVPTRPASSRRSWTVVKQVDPLIQSLVDQVQWTDLIAGVNDIVDLGVRYSYNDHINAVADSLVARFDAIGLQAEKHPFMMMTDERYNLIATQTGVEYPDSIFVVCAHYDATSETPDVNTPGADDNASGTVGVLTCARLLMSLESAYTIQYVLFAGEEQIMVGSEAWASEMAAANVNIVGAMNLDMIGWCGRDAPFDLEIETNGNSRWMADAITNAADLYTTMPYILHEDDSAWWGDFYSFWQNDYAAVNHEEAWDWSDPDFNTNYHTTRDLPYRLNEDFMTGSVKIAVAGLATLARVSEVTAVEDDAMPMRALRLTAAPNPFNGRTSLYLELVGGTGPHEVEIFDMTGRRVGRETVDLHEGRGSTDWSAIGPAGEPLASGVYLARLAGRADHGSCRLVHVK